MSAKSTKHIPPAIFWLASLLFFVSGGTGLVYQVVWFKRFSHVWGSTSLAFGAVGASFLFGLGVGAWFFGRHADRVAWPLRWYGLCELAIGGLALVIPAEIAALVDASVGLYARIPEQPLARYFVQFAITLVVIGPPCVLMGGTLPLLIRQLTARRGSLDQATGWLYGINTFGAAAGCYLTGFHFLPAMGLSLTNVVTAVTNMSIGVVALAVGTLAERNLPQPVQAPPGADVRLGARDGRLLALYLAAALSGCGALMLEMTWSRQMALVLGGSTYAYSATLFVVLLGIGLGSLIFHRWLRNVASSPLLPAVVVGVLAVSALAGKASLPWLSLSVAPQDVRDMRGDALANGAICVAASCALELVPAVAMGILFPLFVHLTRAGAAQVGSAVGNVYAFNTLGSIVGASLTAVLLFPTVGTSGAVALAVTLYLIALVAVMPWRERAGALAGCAATLAGAVAAVVIALPVDPLQTNLGLYLYGTSPLGDPKEGAAANSKAGLKVNFFREGASSNVLVTVAGGRRYSLRVNGKVDAGNGADMETQLGLAYLPRIFKPDAQEVMVIGFGSGCTSGAALEFAGTRVTCCEIEPAVYEAADVFGEWNHRPYEKSRGWLEAQNAELPADKRLSPDEIEAQARFAIVFGDGRTAVQGSDKKYDLIISEPSNPWLAGVSNLFTQEFFHTAREHLSAGGVLAQWIQAYNFTISDYLMIVRTLRTEFPHYGVLFLSGGADTILLASNEPLLPDAAQIARLQAVVDGDPAMAADCKRWFGGSDLRWLLLQYYQLGEEQLDKLVDADGSQLLNTDAHLRLEFDAPLHVFRKLSSEQSANYVLVSSATMRWHEQLAQRLGVRFDSAECHRRLGGYLVNQLSNVELNKHLANLGQLDRASNHLERALAIDAGDQEAYRSLATLRWLQDRREEAAKMFVEVIRRNPDDTLAHARLAEELAKQKQPAQAVEHYREALRLAPGTDAEDQFFLWANNLAWILATCPDPQVRNGTEAVAWARKACEHRGDDQPDLLDTLASALAEAGQFDEAIKVSRRLLELAADEPALVKTTQERIRLFEAEQPYHEP